MGAALDPEQVFKDYLRALADDSSYAARSVYALLVYRHKLAKSPALVEKLNRHPAFWQRTWHSIQADAVSSLGRLYDTHQNAHRTSRLFQYTLDNLQIFSSSALEARVANRLGQPGAITFAADAHILVVADFKDMRRELAKCSDIFQAKLVGIRNNFYAHSGQISLPEMHQWMSDVEVQELERITVFPLQFHQALRDLYQNGSKPNLLVARKDVAEMIQKPVGKAVSTLEHEYVVKETAEFLEWLEKT
jgi:hypothetical protein